MLPSQPIPNKILIVRLSALGDVVQTLPVLSRLRATYPNATIGWLVESDAAALLTGNPLLDHLHVSHRKRWNKSLRKPGQWPQTLREVRDFFGDIRAVGYDVALDLQGLMKSSLTLRMTGIRRRVGFACARELAPLLYTETIASPTREAFFDPATPVLQHFMAMTRHLGCESEPITYPLPVLSEETRQRVEVLLAGFYVNAPVVALAPATQWPSKHWPSEYWTRLIQQVLAETDLNLVLVGGPKDTTLIQTILAPVAPEAQEGRVLDLAGKTSLQELQLLFETVSLVIGLDSAPLHLAGAVGHAPLIGLYGPTASRRTAPPDSGKTTLLTTEGQLSCQPCDQTQCALGTLACMTGLSPEVVFSQMMALLPSWGILPPLPEPHPG